MFYKSFPSSSLLRVNFFKIWGLRTTASYLSIVLRGRQGPLKHLRATLSFPKQLRSASLEIVLPVGAQWLLVCCVAHPFTASHQVEEAAGPLEGSVEIVGVRPALFVVEVGVDLDDPFGLPLPAAFDGQNDGVSGQLDSTVLVAPVRSLVREEHIFEKSHPDALVLIRLKLPEFVFVCLPLIDEHRVRPVLRLPISCLLIKVLVYLNLRAKIVIRHLLLLLVPCSREMRKMVLILLDLVAVLARRVLAAIHRGDLARVGQPTCPIL